MPYAAGSNSGNTILASPNRSATPLPGAWSSNQTNTTVVNAGLNTAPLPSTDEQVASTTITVLGGSQSLKPAVTVIDPATNAVPQSTQEFRDFTLRGEGFAPGLVNVSIDSTGGQSIGMVTVGGDGTFSAIFRMPGGV